MGEYDEMQTKTFASFFYGYHLCYYCILLVRCVRNKLRQFIDEILPIYFLFYIFRSSVEMTKRSEHRRKRNVRIHARVCKGGKYVKNMA